MAKKETFSIISDDSVINKIYLVRNHKVMLDSDLMKRYGMETTFLNQGMVLLKTLKLYPLGITYI